MPTRVNHRPASGDLEPARGLRWVWAGLAFAALVGLAIATATVRSENVKVRARLRHVDHQVVIHSIESARRVHWARSARGPEALARRWRQVLRVVAER